MFRGLGKAYTIHTHSYSHTTEKRWEASMAFLLLVEADGKLHVTLAGSHCQDMDG